MKEIAPMPFALRYAKMPRGETWVSPELMSPENRQIWEKRCRERAESLREALAELGSDVPDPLPDAHRPAGVKRQPAGLKTAAILALMQRGGRWTAPALAAECGYSMNVVYNSLHTLNERGLIKKVNGRSSAGLRRDEWAAVEGVG